MYEHDLLTEQNIGCAIEAHRHLGPGLYEATYEEALCIEFDESGILYRRQVGIPVLYKGRLIGEHRPDLVVREPVVVEIKSVERIAAVHVAQVLVYVRLLRLPVGLLINFNCAAVRGGIRRLAL